MIVPFKSVDTSNHPQYVDYSASNPVHSAPHVGVVKSDNGLYSDKITKGILGIFATLACSSAASLPSAYSNPFTLEDSGSAYVHNLSETVFDKSESKTDNKHFDSTWDLTSSVLDSTSGDLNDDSVALEQLSALFQFDGTGTLQSIRDWLFRNDIDRKADTIATIVRMVGAINHKNSAFSRMKLVAQFLEHKSPLVREASALSLEDINDPRCVDDLKEAFEAEPYASLKDDYRMIIESLEG